MYSEYNYRKSGKPVSTSEENYAFANERHLESLRQAELIRRAERSTPAAAPARRNLVLRWVTAILSVFHL